MSSLSPWLHERTLITLSTERQDICVDGEAVLDSLLENVMRGENELYPVDHGEEQIM